jgi:hypothetical protein
MMIHRKIYQALLEYCEYYQPLGPVGVSYADVDLYTFASGTETSLKSLRNSFSEKALLASRVVVPYGDKQLLLNPILTEPLNIILPLRPQPGKRPFDLLCRQGTIRGRLPVCAALRDGSIRAAMAETRGALLVVFSMETLAVLRRVGLPVSTACGLARSPANAADACKCLELHPVDVPGGGSSRLVFVNWAPSPADRNELKALDQVRRQFQIYENGVRTPLDVLVWTPHPEDAARISFFRSNGSREQVWEAILASMDEGLVPITMHSDELDRPKDLTEATQRLREALRKRSSRRERRQCWAQYNAKLDQELLAPLTKQALDMLSPEDRLRLFSVAGISSVVYPATEVFLASFARQIASGSIRKVGAAITPEIERLLKSYSLLLNYFKAGQ